MKTQLQSESAECGLACLATAAGLSGLCGDLATLRQRFPQSRRGIDLAGLVELAHEVGFQATPVRADLDDLAHLTLPCVLHWDLTHFVVLHRVRRGRFHIADPAVGDRVLTREAFSPHFTGVALLLAPALDFTPMPVRAGIAWRRVLGRIQGLPLALGRIAAVAVVLEAFTVTAPLLQQLVIDDVLVSADADLLTVLMIGCLLLMLLQTLLGLARSWMVQMLGQDLALQLSAGVFARLVRLPLAFFERRQMGDIASRFGATGAIQRVLTQRPVDALLDGLMAVAALGMMLRYSPPLAGIVVAAVALYALLRWAAFAPYCAAAAERLAVEANEQSYFLETLQAMPALKLFGRERQREVRWQALFREVQRRDVRTARMNIVFSAANALILGLENLLVLWLGARLILAQGTPGAAPFTIGMLFAFIAYKTQFGGRASGLIDFVVELKTLSVQTDRLADIVLAPPDEDDVPVADLSHLPPGIELRDVSFRYSDRDPWVLDKVSLRIPAHEHVALVGPSGSGKSTLMKIALGLLRPTEGEVLYGGIPLRQAGAANVRRLIGTVMQDDALLAGSIADNISFCDPSATAERIEAAARAAVLHEDILRMPMGYASLVGDLGAGLSGGQRQRLLLARCLYKTPRVIALDEATSELDADNERSVAATLRRTRATRLTIAHRPETIAGADRVVELRSGALRVLRDQRDQRAGPLRTSTVGKLAGSVRG
ncbi:peptidase domain-containing ABC transporter [Roseateles chitinivorans]|uniref:peptidase domain-containing ABC transporter n=1 Tax=Roseateles chitinivorans TaxID=2917965 RepID=UPI003D67F96E